MKIELYQISNNKEGELLEKFLKRNNLFFKKIVIQDLIKTQSFLRIKFSHSVHIIKGFNTLKLKQLLEHIKKYSPQVEK